MTVLFVPRPDTATIATAAASGNVLRWTYTVPALKRAVLTHSYLQINANAGAVNLGTVRVECTIGGTVILAAHLIWNAGVVTLTDNSQHDIDLRAGDTVQGFTVNNTAGTIITMVVSAVIKEYQ